MGRSCGSVGAIITKSMPSTPRMAVCWRASRSAKDRTACVFTPNLAATPWGTPGTSAEAPPLSFSYRVRGLLDDSGGLYRLEHEVREQPNKECGDNHDCQTNSQRT